MSTPDLTPDTLPLAYTAPPHACDHASLPVRGALPPWLHGTYFLIGPGSFVVGQRVLEDPLDGFGMIHRFEIGPHGVSFRNRFLRTSYYESAQRLGRIVHRHFGGRPEFRLRDWLRFARNPFDAGADNPTAGMVKLGDRFVATNQMYLVEFDPRTLETVGRYAFEDGTWRDRLSITAGHFHVVDGGDGLLGASMTPGAIALWRMKRDGRRERVADLRVGSTGTLFIHGFAVTERFAVFVLSPWRMWFDFMLTRPLRDTVTWEPQRPTRFYVVDLQSGEVVGEHEADAFVCLHVVNAFEADGVVRVDLAVYEDARAAGWYKTLRENVCVAGELRRYHLPLAGSRRPSRVGFERLDGPRVEFPTIHYERCNGRAYRFLYGCATPSRRSIGYEQIVKVDIERGEHRSWSADGCFPQEGFVVGRPGAAAEDDGVVLTVVLDEGAHRSFLLVLDAATFEEIARAELPHALPLGNHGMFLGAQHAPTFLV